MDKKIKIKDMHLKLLLKLVTLYFVDRHREAFIDTPVLKGNLKKSRKQRSGILHIVGDPSRFPKKPLSKSEN